MKSSFCRALIAMAAALVGSAATAPDDTATTIARMVRGESAVQGRALETALREADAHPLGSEENPVRASMPPGERAYLARLRCADGRAPQYERQGSGDPGPFGNIVDFYAVQCDEAEPVQVVMDMYHAGYVEARPVPGFTIVEP